MKSSRMAHCLVASAAIGFCTIAALLVELPTFGGVSRILPPFIPAVVWCAGGCFAAVCMRFEANPPIPKSILVASAAWTLWVVLGHVVRWNADLLSYVGGDSQLYWIGVLAFTGLLVGYGIVARRSLST